MGSSNKEARKYDLCQEMMEMYQVRNMKEFSDMFKDMFAEGMPASIRRRTGRRTQIFKIRL